MRSGNLISAEKASELLNLLDNKDNLKIINGKSVASEEIEKALNNFETEGKDTTELTEYINSRL
jgi:L-lactate utilization protein LutB